MARRYRPQIFGDLVGQEHVTRALTSAIATNRVGHAYLFCGSRGVGKTSAARILAKALNCVDGPSEIPCNRCDICLSIASGEDVDVLEIDGASNRGIDEVRQLRNNVLVRPSRARHKIYIIDEVHMLTGPAFNALLKTLEEPPKHVKFIFCTTDPKKIPITVRSRCQRFDFAAIHTDAIVERLQKIATTEGTDVDPEAMHILARRAAGSMRDGQSLLDQLLAFGQDTISTDDVHSLLGTAGSGRLSRLVHHLVEGNGADALAELDGTLSDGADVGPLIDQLIGWFRDVMAISVGCKPELLLHTDQADVDDLSDVGKRLGLETILAIIQILDQTVARMSQSTHARVLLELALVRISHLEDLEELPSMIARLQELDGPPSTGSESEGSKKKIIDVDSKPTSHAAGPIQGPHPGPTSPLTPENALNLWKQSVLSLSGMIREHALRAESVAISAPNRLAVFFRSRYNSCRLFCQQPDKVQELERAISALTGESVRIQFKMDEDGDDSAAELATPPSRGEQIQQVLGRTFVRQAAELFQAEVIRVEQPTPTSAASELDHSDPRPLSDG